MYSGNQVLFQEKYTSDSLVESRFNIVAGGQILGQVRKVGANDPVFLFFGLDNLESRRVAWNADGTVKVKFSYSPWGEFTRSGGLAADEYLASFTGKEYDATGLLYFNARYYDPQVGRFITEDPARKGHGWYSYCGNNPLSVVDPTGMIDMEAAALEGEISPEQMAEEERREAREARREARAAKNAYWDFWRNGGDDLLQRSGLTPALFAALCTGALVEPTPIGEIALGLVVAFAALMTMWRDGATGMEIVLESPRQTRTLYRGALPRDLEEWEAGGPIYSNFIRAIQDVFTNNRGNTSLLHRDPNLAKAIPRGSLSNQEMNVLANNHALHIKSMPSPFVGGSTNFGASKNFAKAYATNIVFVIESDRAILNIVNMIGWEAEWLLPLVLRRDEVVDIRRIGN